MPADDIALTIFSDTVYFSKSGSQQTPAHNYSDFRFRTYASFAFRTFRKLFSIETDLFLASLCSEPMIELSNPGASGSIFYVTSDDNFVCKTVDHKEGEFLKILLAGYYLNLQQNQNQLNKMDKARIVDGSGDLKLGGPSCQPHVLNIV